MKTQLGSSSAERWQKRYEWHEWCAWHPVITTERKLAWLETVERQMYDEEREVEGSIATYTGQAFRYRERAKG